MNLCRQWVLKTPYFSSLSQNKTWQIHLLIPKLHVGDTWVRCTISPDTKAELLACCASPANEGLNAGPSQGLHAHRHWLGGWQPVGIVIPWCKVTDIVDVAEHEGHGAETSKTAPSSTYRVKHIRQQSFHFIAFFSNSCRTVLVDPSSPSFECIAVLSDCHMGEKLHFSILFYLPSSWITMCILWR